MRCGIKFLPLSSSKEKQIDGFMRGFTINPSMEHPA
jgi:hypothetical protein